MNILRTHHVAVICSDNERSKRLYTHVLDLRLPDGTQIELFPT